MSNGINMYDIRINEIRNRVNTRLNEISQRTGLSFNEFMATATEAETEATTSLTNTNVSAELLKSGLLATEQNKQIADLLQQIATAQAAQAAQSGIYTTGAPQSMNGIIESVAAVYGIDVNLVKAVAQAGSNFDAGLLSADGAIGVMQLMPATAIGLGVGDPYDPQQNIDGGARYLKGQLERYDGDMLMAIAAYSAGGSTLNKLGITDLNDSTQFALLPQETQDYIRRVLDYYATYSAQG